MDVCATELKKHAPLPATDTYSISDYLIFLYIIYIILIKKI